MARLLKKDGGFSILEVLIALLILAIGIMAVSTLFDNAYRAEGSATSLNNANRLAQSYVDRCSTYGYQNVLNGMGTANYQVSGSTKTNWKDETVNNVNYRVTLQVQESYIITGAITVHKTLVTVSWTERGRQRQVKLETYL